MRCPRQAWKSWPSTTGLETCIRTSRPAKRRVRRPTAKAPAGTVRTVARLLIEAQATPRQPSRTWTSEDEEALEAAFQQAQASELPRNLTCKFHQLQCSGGEDKIRCRRDSSCAVPRHATQAPQEPHEHINADSQCDHHGLPGTARSPRRAPTSACRRGFPQPRNQTGPPLSFPSVASTHVRARKGTKTPWGLLIHVNRKNQTEKRCCKEKKLPPRRGGASTSGASSSSHSNRPRPNARPSIQAGHVAPIQVRTRNGFLPNK